MACLRLPEISKRSFSGRILVTTLVNHHFDHLSQLKSSKGAELGATSSLSSANFILSVAKDQRRSASRSTSMTARLRLKS